LPDFVDTAVKEIDDQLRVLRDEASRLEAARAALTGGRRGGRAASKGAAINGTARTTARSAERRNGAAAAVRARPSGETRANQALDLVRQQPGITIPDIAQAMSIQPNYLYRVLPRLASEGQIKREGQGWHPSSSSTTSTGATGARKARGSRQAPAAETEAPRAPRSPRGTRSTSPSNGRAARGASRAAILAALASGEALTASEVATKAGLARPTVSTTLSKLAKSGEVKKAERGYRVTSAG